MTLTYIWKGEGRFHRRRDASQECGIVCARVCRDEKAGQVLCDQNVEIKWQEMGLFVSLEQAVSEKGILPLILINQGSDLIRRSSITVRGQL